MSKYQKQPLAISQQIQLLKERGLSIENEEYTANSLAHVGYYHLSAYCKHFQYIDDQFVQSTSFQNIMDMYAFDRRLVLLFFDAIERIEISLRSVLTDTMTQEKGGVFWYREKMHFVDKFDHNKETFFLEDRIKRARKKDGFLRQYFDKYHEETFPPSWILMEILAFGDVLTLFQNLHRPYRKKIARCYGINERVLISWLRGLLDIRNICAHHERLWNRKVRMPIVPSDSQVITLPAEANKIFSYVIIASFLIRKISPTSTWSNKAAKLIHESPDIFSLGCPDNWEAFISKGDAT